MFTVQDVTDWKLRKYTRRFNVLLSLHVPTLVHVSSPCINGTRCGILCMTLPLGRFMCAEFQTGHSRFW
jgi:hypothetical protein